MKEPLLRIQDLAIGLVAGRDYLPVIGDLSFEIRPGETFALLGESGCGKSMTALSLSRLLPHAFNVFRSSQVYLDNINLVNLPEVKMHHIRGLRIAMIFQEPMTSLNPVLSVGDQIGEVLRIHRHLRGKRLRARTLELLDAVGIPDPHYCRQQYPHQLSGGMKQRVMIAIALAGEPDLLIADEPTTALDVTIQAQILQLLQELQQKTGMAILLITHDLGVVHEVADRIAVMYAGHLVEVSECRKFFADPAHPYSQKLLACVPTLGKRQQILSVIPGQVPPLTAKKPACRFADRCEYAQAICREVAPIWSEGPSPLALTEHQVRCHLYDPNQQAKFTHQNHKMATVSEIRRKPQETEILLAVRDLKVHFPIHKGVLKRVVGHVKAVDGIDLTVNKGQTVALVGESGSGKTTTAKAIIGLHPLTAGQIEFQQQDLSHVRVRAQAPLRRDMQFIFQDPFSSMNPRMLVEDIIAEGLVAQKIDRRSNKRCAWVTELLDLVGLPKTSLKRYPHEFSGGQRQRIGIARALALNPKLLICDEPTSALDVSVQAQILNLLKSLQAELGISYLFITHDIAVVAYIADEIAVMYQGKIVEQGSARQILSAPAHAYTKTLLNAVIHL